MEKDTSILFPFEVDPASSPILYHYCSTNAFLSVIQSKRIWMSDVNTMNDFGEIHWAYERFIEAANFVLDRIDREYLDALDKVIARGQLKLLPLIFSLSSDGDVLSQWRAYAQDGAGMAIGFDTALLKTLSTTMARVEYSHQKQIEHFKAMIVAGNQIYREEKKAKRDQFIFEHGAHMFMNMCCFKNPGFSEEKEVRLIRATNVSYQNSVWSLVDAGGSGEKRSARVQQVKYRSSRDGGIVAHIELPLEGLGNSAIKEVVLGPKTQNSGNEVSMVMSSAGFRGCRIRKSEATYR